MKVMKDELISFNTAKVAKEKGFMELTPYYYFDDGELREHVLEGQNGYYGEDYLWKLEDFYEQWNDGFLTKKNGDRCFGCSKSKGYFETFAATTQSLLQKWLRDKHNIHIHLEYLGGDSYYAESTNFNAEITYVMEQYTGTYEYVLETLLFITLSKMN